MKPRIEVFKKIGDQIAEAIKASDTDKRLKKIEYAKTFENFRLQLLRINQERIIKGQPDPLITLENYFTDLFPEGYKSWRETRDILLFRIYEQLHSWLIDKKYDLSEEEEEE